MKTKPVKPTKTVTNSSTIKPGADNKNNEAPGEKIAVENDGRISVSLPMVRPHEQIWYRPRKHKKNRLGAKKYGESRDTRMPWAMCPSFFDNKVQSTLLALKKTAHNASFALRLWAALDTLNPRNHEGFQEPYRITELGFMFFTTHDAWNKNLQKIGREIAVALYERPTEVAAVISAVTRFHEKSPREWSDGMKLAYLCNQFEPTECKIETRYEVELRGLNGLKSLLRIGEGQPQKPDLSLEEMVAWASDDQRKRGINPDPEKLRAHWSEKIKTPLPPVPITWPELIGIYREIFGRTQQINSKVDLFKIPFSRERTRRTKILAKWGLPPNQ